MRVVQTFAILTLCLLAEILHAQGGKNVQFIGQLRTRGTSGYSNCWGYNAPNGKEYAIVGCVGGTQIVDITGDTLKEVAFIPGPSSGWREMKVYQHYAYVVTEGAGAGLQIIDLDSLKLVNTITTLQVPSGHTVSIEGKYLYINGGRYKSGGVVILDLTDPVNPVYVGEYQGLYVHDCVIKNDTIYAAAVYGQGLDIINAVNKANPTRVSITNYPHSGTHNTDVTADRKYVFTTDEINSGENGNILRVWDRTDVTNLKLVGSYVARPNTIVHNIHLKGEYGYLSHYSEGVRILDLKYPEIPVEVAHYDSYVGSVNNYVGAWGTFPYFNSNKVIISDMSGGLFVFRFPGQDGSVKAARTIVTVRDSVTNLPVSGVTVTIPGFTEAFISDNQGNVKFGALYDTATASFSKTTYSQGYYSKSEKITMKFDSVALVTVLLKPIPSGSLTVTVKDKVTSAPLKQFRMSVENTPVAGFTDSTGTFTVPSLLGGNQFKVIAAQWGYLPETAAVNIIGGTNNNVSFQLTAKGMDDFEYDLGWTVGSPTDSGTNGVWERTTATRAAFGKDTLQPGYDHSFIGTKVFVTGGSSVASNNVDRRTTLTSPVFSTATFANPSMLFWLYMNSLSSVQDDTLFVEVSNNAGGNWKRAAWFTGKQPYWKQHLINFNGITSATDQMRIRFVAYDGGAASLFDASIDDIEYGDNLQLSVEPEPLPVPTAFKLMQNYPNPFNPSTVIAFSLPQQSHVSLRIYDVVGREVATLMNEVRPAGEMNVEWNGTNALGQLMESGVYFYTVKAGANVSTKKMILLK